MSLDLPPEAAALRDRAVSPLLALLEQREIADRLTAIEIEHARSKHPSTYGDDVLRFDQLRPGMAVEHDREWWGIVTVRSDGSMLLCREGDRHEEWVRDQAPDAPWTIAPPF